MNTSSKTLLHVCRSLGRYLPLLLLSLLLAAASVAGTLYIPILVGDAIDAIVGPGQVDFQAVGTLAIRIAVLAGLTALLQWLMTVIHNRVCFAVTRDVRRQAFARLQKLPLSYLDSHPAGDTLSRIVADVDQFADGLLMGFTQLFTGVLTIVGTIGFMLSISWEGQLDACTMKNWLPLVLVPLFAIDSAPRKLCNSGANSSSNASPQMLSPPVPSPFGSPP